MKKALLLVCALALAAGLAGAAEVSKFKMPSDEEIAAIAQDPSVFSKYLQDATDSEAVDMLFKIIASIDSLGLDGDARKNRVGQLLAEVSKVKGPAAPPIIAKIIGPTEDSGPSDEQIMAIAKDPSKLKDAIADMSEDEAVDLLLKIIAAVETLGLSDAAAQQRIGQLLAETAKIKGASAPPIIARVLKKVNPRLLPVIHWGSMPGMPPNTPGYKRQR